MRDCPTHFPRILEFLWPNDVAAFFPIFFPLTIEVRTYSHLFRLPFFALFSFSSLVPSCASFSSVFPIYFANRLSNTRIPFRSHGRCSILLVQRAIPVTQILAPLHKLDFTYRFRSSSVCSNRSSRFTLICFRPMSHLFQDVPFSPNPFFAFFFVRAAIEWPSMSLSLPLECLPGPFHVEDSSPPPQSNGS